MKITVAGIKKQIRVSYEDESKIKIGDKISIARWEEHTARGAVVNVGFCVGDYVNQTNGFDVSASGNYNICTGAKLRKIIAITN